MRLISIIGLAMCCHIIMAQTPGIKHVLVIGVDGMSPDGIMKAPTPVMDSLMAKGAFTFKDKAVLRTNSSPNWASMIMGADHNKHKVHTNNWELSKIRKKSLCGGKKGELWPTIFRIVREAKPQANIAVFHDWDGFGRLVENNVCTVKKDCNAEDSATLEAAAYIKQHQPLLTFLHLDHVDHAGHADGHGSPSYYQAVAKADSLIGVLLNSLQKAGIDKETLVIITADHGGKGHGHGGRSDAERLVPWIIYGPGVTKGKTITTEVNTYDTAATIAWVLGIQPPECWTAQPVTDAFETTTVKK
ncbi:MAG: alkaline phosphatase [Chitinophagales bacterium]|nr:alkaline phosphatase [Chitinophagales bacterium]